MKYLKEWSQFNSDLIYDNLKESVESGKLFHHISHYQYLQGLDGETEFSNIEGQKIKEVILNSNPKWQVKVLSVYVKANIEYNNYTKTQIKIYPIPDEWYIVSVLKEFRLVKNYFYYKCDGLEGLSELMAWI